MNITKNNVSDVVKSGIVRAVKEHLELTNDYSELSWAPEYYLTTLIAQELGRLDNACVFLEEKMGESHGSVKGRRPKHYKPKGRFDMVVRNNSGYAVVAIEVKHRVYSVSKDVLRDTKRLVRAVRSDLGEGQDFKFGIFAFYTVVFAKERKTMEPKDAISRLYKRLQEKVSEDEASPKNIKLVGDFITPTKYRNQDWGCWGGGTLIFSAK